MDVAFLHKTQNDSSSNKDELARIRSYAAFLLNEASSEDDRTFAPFDFSLLDEPEQPTPMGAQERRPRQTQKRQVQKIPHKKKHALSREEAAFSVTESMRLLATLVLCCIVAVIAGLFVLSF